MKNMTKRSFALFLAIVMCLSLLNLSVFADDSNVVDIAYDCGQVEGHTHTDACYVTSEKLICEDADETEEPETPAEEPEPSDETGDADKVETGDETGDANKVETGVESGDANKVETGDETGDANKVETGYETGDANKVETGDETGDADKVETGDETGNADKGETTEETETSEPTVAGEETGASLGENAPVDGNLYRPAHRAIRAYREAHEDADVHEHTEECYETVQELICELEENHVHVLECSNAAVDFVAGFAVLMEKAEALMEKQAQEDGEEMTEEEFNEIVALTEELDALYDMIPAGLREDESVTMAKSMLDMLKESLQISTLMTEDALRTALSNGGTVNVTSNVDVKSTITISKNATLNLNGHTINYTGSTGSVFHVTGGTFTLNGGGTIKGGKGTNVKWNEIVDRDKTNGEPAGGAVLVESGATFTMNGGTITGNSATWGGGIAVARGGNLNIYGGTISGNTATSAGNDTLSGAATGKYGGGGGIFCAGTGLINPTQGSISITGNTTGTVNDLGGGGIFIESKGTMKIYNAVVTGNTASGQGGGVAGCLHGKVSNIAPQTAAIYGNTANNERVVSRLNVIDHNDWWHGKSGVSKANDYFCAGYSVVGKLSMNGGDAKWTGWKATSASSGVSATSGDPIVVQGVTGLTVGAGNNVEAKAASFSGSKVTISGNNSSMHGGGIGCNGTLSFGEESFSYSTSKINIKATKSVSGAQGNDGQLNGYTFVLKKGNDVIGTATSDANGNIEFKNLSTAMLFGESTKTGNVSVTLTLTENGGSKTGMTYDTTPRTIVINATRSDNPVGNVSTGSGGVDVTTHVFTDVLKSATVSQGTATVSGTTVTLNGAANFTNTMAYGKVSVTKNVVETLASGKAFSFEVKIGNDTFYPTLKNGGTWTSGDYPVGTKYTVKETGDTSGYTKSGEVANVEIESGTNSVTVINTRDEKSLTVTKKVDSNETSVKPGDDQFTISVTLGDGSDTTDRGAATVYAGMGVYTFELKNGQSATITGIPTGTQYLVTEGAMPAYEYTNTNKTELDNRTSLTKDTTVDVLNYYYKAKTTDVSVTKTWNGGEGYRPTSVWIQLMQNGEDYGEKARLCATNEWTKVWNDLPLYEGDGGKAYTYTVKEVSVDYRAMDDGYSADERVGNIIRVRSSVAAEDGSGNEIVGGWVVNESGSVADGKSDIALINNWRSYKELGETDFTVKKIDSETKKGIGNVKFTLTRGDYSETLPTGDDGSVTFSSLVDGEYILTETDAPDAYKGIMGEDGKDINVGREWKVNIVKNGLASVEKIANDENTDGVNGILGKNTWNWIPSVGGVKAGTLTIENQIIKGQIGVKKVLNLDGVDQDVIDELKNVNFIFDIYDGDEIVDTLTVKADGETVKSKELRFGEYTVKERQADIPNGSDLINYVWKEAVLDNNGKVKIDKQNSVDVFETFPITATNSFERNTGDLSVTKTVTGGRGDRTKAWNFEVTLKAPADYVSFAAEYAATISGGETEDSVSVKTLTRDELLEMAIAEWNAKQEDLPEEERVPFDEEAWMAKHTEDGVRYFVFQLTHGQTLKIKGLPVGTEYTVTEIEANTDGYRTTANGADGTIAADVEADAQFINNRPNPNNPPENPPEPPEEPEIPDPEVPLDPFDPEEPEPDEDVELPDPDVPLAEFEIPDEDVPLSDVPTTGDNSGIWTILAIISGIGLVWLALEDRKRKNNAK